jgi:hypothetical protein
MTESMVERVAEAIDAVALFSRYNDWTSDRVPGLPIEICRHGTGGEAEIVVVGRFPSSFGEDEALAEMVTEARARAAIEAMREPTTKMLKASPIVGTGINEDGKWGINTRPAADVWTAMIDAALTEPPQEPE